MRARVLVVGVLVLAGLAACGSSSKKGETSPEEMRERATRFEQHYQLPPGDARFAASRFPGLDTDPAYSTYDTLASKLGLAHLSLDDAEALDVLAKRSEKDRDALVARATSDEQVALVGKLRDALGYEFQIREVDLVASLDPAVVARATTPQVAQAVKLVRARRPMARFPLVALGSAIELGTASEADIATALDRFTRLEVDLGVREINPRTFAVLAYVAPRPDALAALSTVKVHIPDLDIGSVTSAGVDTIARVGSTALAETLNGIQGTHFAKRIGALDRATARSLVELASAPGAPALVPLFEASLPEFHFDDERDAAALASIAALGTEGRAALVLSKAFRSGILIDSLDRPSTDFLKALISDPDLLVPVRTLHSVWPAWQATPADLQAIRLLGTGPELGKLAVSIRHAGFELRNTLGVETARELAQLAQEGAAAIADALGLIFPRLTITDTTALHELHEIVAAGIAPADILRLENDTFAGNLGPRIRSALVTKARSARGG